MKLRLTVTEQKLSSLLDKLTPWGATIISKDEAENQLSVVSLI